MNREKKKIIVLISLILLGGLFWGSQSTVQILAGPQKVVVGTNAEYAPFEYLDSDGNLTGFDYELLEAVAKSEGVELEWRDMPFDSLVGSMEAGDIEVIAAGIGPTKEREKSVDFSDVYYSGSQSIISRSDYKFEDFASLSGKKVAVLEGSQSDFIVSGENTDYGTVENAVPIRFKTASSVVMELKNGGADAVLIDTIMAEIYCRETDGIVSEDIPGTEEDTVFCIEKGNEEIREMINCGLNKVRQEGIYDELYEKYFSGEEEGGTEITAVSEQTGFLETLKFIFLEENRWKYYVNGLKITIIVSLLSMCVGMVIGLCVALIRLDADRKRKVTIVSGIMSAYVDVIRGYVAAVVSFGINSGAYVSEVIRGGILAVDRGQMEAGRSLGLGYGDTMRFIIIPQAVKNILPAMGNEFIQLIKETSILGYVGIVDLTKASSYVSSRTYQMFIPLVAAGMMYYLIVKVLSVMLGKLERRLRESD